MTHSIRDHLPLLARDMVAAFGLLTRIPVPFTLPRPAGVWAWPLVGLVTGGTALAVAALGLWLGLAAGVVAYVCEKWRKGEIPLARIATACDVSVATLQKCLRRLQGILDAE